jgi:hypothetical protein
MEAVAELFDALLHRGVPTEEVARRAAELKSGFTRVQYCFGAGEAAYRYYDLVGRDPT